MKYILRDLRDSTYFTSVRGEDEVGTFGDELSAHHFYFCQDAEEVGRFILGSDRYAIEIVKCE